MDDADEWLYATHRRDVGDSRHRATAQWGTGENSASAHRADDGAGGSGAEYGRPPKKRQGGSGDLPKPVHFVSAAVSSGNHGDSRSHPASSGSGGDPARRAASPPAPGSLASNAVVANIMKRMNYREGTGLGRHGQGIVDPIDVIPRPKNAGLGTAEGLFISGAFDPPPSAEDWPKWDEAGGGAKKRKRDRTLPDEKILVRPLEEESAAEAFARVKKALTRAARWSSPSSGLGDPRYGEETAAITKVMERVQEASASGTLTAAELTREFTALKDMYPREYTAYRLADAARAVAAALLRAAVFREWEPLEDPSRGLEAVAGLRDTLLDDGLTASPYAALVDDVVVGPVLASGKAWEPRDPEPMVQFLMAWGGALPVPAIQRVLDRVVVPKLSAAVESWEPRWEAVPCHVWVHPWIPLLGRLLEPLYATVRRKLEEELRGRWHASRALDDADMVAPWKEAFGPAAWAELVGRHVVPYLREGLRAVRVAPPERGDGGFGGVKRWAASSVVSPREMARLLEEEFFGRWLDALCRWLWAERPTVAEATAWHEGWKRLLTPELLADERVRAPIDAGLQKISDAAQGLEVYRPHGRGQHAGETHSSCRYRSRLPAAVGRGRNNNRQ